jgi:putative tryptophan/tyrosine transport system substrate-binding protein
VKRSAALGIVLLGALGGLPAAAQQAGKTYRVGILSGVSLVTDGRLVSALRGALSALGYQEGKNLEIVYRAANRDLTRLPALAADLVRAKPDVIVVEGTGVIKTIQRVTMSIPIVIVYSSNAVALGFVASLAHPGGNITGMTTGMAELFGKDLQILKELVPHIERVAVIRNPSNAANLASWRVAESVAPSLGIHVFAVNLNSPEQTDAAFKTIRSLRADAAAVLPGAATPTQPERFVRLAAAQRLPAIYTIEAYVTAGGLVYYGPSEIADWREAATYVDRILKGANPADLPVDRPKTFELIVNLKTARSLGITVPQSILLRADEVIK